MKYAILMPLFSAVAVCGQAQTAPNTFTYGEPKIFDTVVVTDPISGNEDYRVTQRQSITGMAGKPVYGIQEVRLSATPLKCAEVQVLDKLQRVLYHGPIPDGNLLLPQQEVVIDENGHVVSSPHFEVRFRGSDGAMRTIAVPGAEHFFDDIELAPATYNGVKVLYRQVLSWADYLVVIKDHEVLYQKIAR